MAKIRPELTRPRKALSAAGYLAYWAIKLRLGPTFGSLPHSPRIPLILACIPSIRLELFPRSGLLRQAHGHRLPGTLPSQSPNGRLSDLRVL